MVEDLDRSVGEVLKALKRSGQEEDTLVVFSSDNGGERFSYNWPLSGNKASLQEGGIRVPNIARWPARLDGGQVSHVPVFSPDWTATLLELAGARPHPAYPLDGVSLAGYLLRGEKPAERDLFWRVRGSGRCAAGTGSTTAARRAVTSSSTWPPMSANRPTGRAGSRRGWRSCGRPGSA